MLEVCAVEDIEQITPNEESKKTKAQKKADKLLQFQKKNGMIVVWMKIRS